MRGLSSVDECSHEGRNSFASGNAVLSPRRGSTGCKCTRSVLMGWGQEGQAASGLALQRAYSVCLCSVWLYAELTSPGLCDNM